MAWTNGAIKVYHGTIDAHAHAVAASPDPSIGRALADFGKGFYVTSDLVQAQQWANQRARSVMLYPVNAAVVEFEMDRDQLGKFGDHLVFPLADQDFSDFVEFNRVGGSAHYRGTLGLKAYSVVYGPVAAYPQTLTYANCAQICIVESGELSNAAAVVNSRIFSLPGNVILPVSPPYF